MLHPELDEAITRAVHAEADAEGATPGLVVTEYVVLAATTGWNAEGDSVSQVVTFDSDSPPHHILGLLLDGITKAKAEALAAYMDD